MYSMIKTQNVCWDSKSCQCNFQITTMMSASRFFSKKLYVLFESTERTLARSEKFHYKPQIKTLTTYLSTRNDQIRFSGAKLFHSSHRKNFFKKDSSKDEVDEYDEQKSLIYYSEFDKWEKKDKKTFIKTVKFYKQNVKNRAGHVDFIKAALKKMKDYNVHRDLECYKKVIDVFPKGVYLCTNKLMVDGMYYPRQQFVAIQLLDQMGENGVMLDAELGMILRNIFGKDAHPCQKFEQMLYWMVKLRNKTPFPLPDVLPKDPLLLAKLMIDRITKVDLQTEISVYQTSQIIESIDKTWIVSGQSPKQKKLLEKHPKNLPVVVEGGDKVWLDCHTINYFVLKADIMPKPFKPPENIDDISNLKSKYFNPNYIVKDERQTVHEQDDGIIYAVCATGTSSKDSLLSWVRILQKMGNPILLDLPVLFRFGEKEKLPFPVSDSLVNQ